MWSKKNSYSFQAEVKNCTATFKDSLAVSHKSKWYPTPVLLPGKSHGRRSLVGCSPWGRQESDTTERLHFHFSFLCIGEGNGNPLQCSCLENPRDGGAWWAAVYGVAQSWTRLKRLSIAQHSTNLNIILSMCSNYYTSRYLPKNVESFCPNKNKNTDIYNKLIINVKTWKQTRCHSVGEQISKLYHLYNGIQRNELQSHETSWKKLNAYCNMKEVHLKRLYCILHDSNYIVSWKR